jgi:hypothetical protein
MIQVLLSTSAIDKLELISAFYVLQKFRDYINTENVVELDDSNLENFELGVTSGKKNSRGSILIKHIAPYRLYWCLYLKAVAP